MESKDDPEARIRELEQASGANRATELGVGESGASYSYAPPVEPDSYVPPTPASSYMPPHPTPPSGYPPPSGYAPPSGYPPPSQPWSGTPPPPGPFAGTPAYLRPSWGTAKRSGSRRLALIPIVIVLFAFAPSVVSLVTNAFNGFRSSSHNSGGLTFAPTTASPISSIPAKGGIITLADDGREKTVACNDSTVVVQGNSNSITIAGHCSSLTVAGGNNTIDVDTTDAITVAGSGNKVTWHSGAPQVNNPFSGNVVVQG